MTNLLSSGVQGVELPTHSTGPRVLRSLGEDAVDLAGLAGLHLDDWQADVLEGALGRSAGGNWSAFEVGLIVPRQNGKGSVLEARELHALFREPDSRLILHSAHEFKTAKEAFRRIVSLVENTPLLKAQVDHVRYTTGEEGIETKDGSRLKFVARSSGSGRGFSGDLIILDEAYNLSLDMMAALLPTMSARPNPQIWYTSSAPLPVASSDVLRKLCKRGRAGGSQSLVYSEWCAAHSDAVDDRGAWARANPALGIRITEEFISRELEALGPEDFARERLGVWSDLEQGGGVIDVDRWSDRLDAESKLSGQPSFALDVSPDRAWSSIGVAGGRHVELVDRRPGTAWLAERAVEVQEKWGGQFAVAKGSPAWSLKDELEAAGVKLLPIVTEEHAQACGDFYDAVMEGHLWHIGQPELDAAVAGADRRYYGDAWLWSRLRSSVDISPLVAVTLAHWVAQKRPRQSWIV
jgi:phage terminase large subunit-like protein